MMKQTILFMLLFGVLVSCKKEEKEENPISTPQPSQTIPADFAALAGIFEGEGVGAAMHLKDDIILLFNQDGDRYAWFEDQEIKVVRDIEDDEGPLANCPLNAIGAGAKTSFSRLYVYDDDGEKYTFANFDYGDVEGEFNNENFFTWSTSSPFDVWLWGSNYSNPFGSISAMWPQSELNGDCFDAEVAFDYLIMADGNGDDLVDYKVSNGTFDTEFDIDEFTAENNCGNLDGLMPFESIGAACRHVKPNQIREIFFNAEGNQFCYFTSSEGVFSDIYELY